MNIEKEEQIHEKIYSAQPSKTPEWVRTLCPQLPENLPPEIIQELEEWRIKEEQKKHYHISSTRGILEECIACYMNNFPLRIIDRETKNKSEKPKMPQDRISDVLKGKTWQEFYTEIDQALEQTGLTIEEVKKLRESGNYEKVNISLLPAFLLLRQRGYNRYPDLAL